MLGSGKLVGFVPTTDYEKARAFYVGKLGFEFISLDQFALVVKVGGHMIRITKMPNYAPLQGTILGWEVDNIEAEQTGTASWEIEVIKTRGLDKAANLDIETIELASTDAAKVALMGGGADMIAEDWLWAA